ncbi:3-hydroxyacyl-CoA dehydrogenase family protein [Azorhizophilus paspali]|uniref:3-hydroxyacyl-CoA dehydrogenase family protein n=1 Tax=Azorhizophilus paspali TaxID=69963 RepID=A0ABV6SH94_AZOPA
MSASPIVILGAGLMGIGIATHLARHGHAVLLRDPAAKLEAVRRLLAGMELEAVVLDKVIPGFIGNRLQFAVLREALHIVRSGTASEETVDRVMRASLGRRYAMLGPLEAADMGALDTFLDIFRHLVPTLADDESVLVLLEARIGEGHTGLRSGEGFYRWDEARRARVPQRRARQLRHALKP